MNKLMTNYVFLIVIVISLLTFSSCSKDNNDGNNTVVNKPKVGTKWFYRYSTFHSSGGLNTVIDVEYRATTEETLNGEKYLKIVDMANNSTKFYLQEKNGSLYQYINNSSHLMAKYPASINESYRSYNGIDSADYFVRSLDQVSNFGSMGSLSVNYYEAIWNSVVVDRIWYDKKVWLLKREMYGKNIILGTYYKSAMLDLQSIVY